MNTQNRAWLYTHIDAPEDTHGALKAQEHELADYAEQARLTVVGFSSDIGTMEMYESPGFVEVTLAAENGEFDILLVQKLSRLTLNTVGVAKYVQHLRKYGVEVISPLEGEPNA